MAREYDVVILGGGLAGLTLGRHIKQAEPKIEIAIIEKRPDSAPTAAHKVGESTVELATYYFREVLGLKDYLEEHHLHKHGLRFFFSPESINTIEDRVEFGPKNELLVPSHQIDRGMFENDLTKMNRDLGIDVFLGASIKSANLSDEGHELSANIEGEEVAFKSNWVVDATGRASFLKRKEGFKKDTTHNVNAIWFRVDGDIDIADWSDNTDWKNQLNPGLRRLGTVHFMGKGYWVWFIPLSSGITSVGIVADPRFHDFTDLNSLDKAYKWLAKNEPQCAKRLEYKKEQVLDFRVLKDFSYGTEMFYSTEKWGVVGEAGAFLDPFYSPGSDFISIGNTWMADLILRDFSGEDVHTRSIVYDKVHSRLFENWLPIYQDKYELFDNAQVMTVKITWDFAVYWAIPSLLFTNGGLVNMNVLKALFTVENSLGERFGKLNKQVQDFYLDWGRIENKLCKPAYIDPMQVDFMSSLQTGLEFIHDSDEELISKLESNLSKLEEMAAEIFRVVASKIKGTPEDLKVDPYRMSLNLSTKELLQIGDSDQGLERKDEMAKAVSPLWLNENK